MRETATGSPLAPRNPLDAQESYNSSQFSQAVLVGNTLWLSGPLGGGREGHREGTMNDEVRIALHQLALTLEAARAAVTGILELTPQSIDRDALSRFAALESDFDGQNLPAWIAVGVLEPALPEMVIEVKTNAISTVSGSRGECHL